MTATLTPDRSVQQRLEGLAKANRVRSERKQLKADLKAGRLTVVPLLLDPPEFIGSMKVADLLLAVRRLGAVKVGTLLKRCAISPSKTVGGLSGRQRMALVATLSQFGRRYER